MGREFEHPLSEFGSLLSDNMEIVGKNNDSVAIVITINRVVLVIQSIRSSTILNSNSTTLQKNDMYMVPTTCAPLFSKK